MAGAPILAIIIAMSAHLLICGTPLTTIRYLEWNFLPCILKLCDHWLASLLCLLKPDDPKSNVGTFWQGAVVRKPGFKSACSGEARLKNTVHFCGDGQVWQHVV